MLRRPVYQLKKVLRTVSHRNRGMQWLYHVANRAKVSLLSLVSDEKFAQLRYAENTGMNLDLQHPRTYNEKLWWLKFNNRDPLLTVCSDKYLVRQYVADCGLAHILNECYGVYESVDEIDLERLPGRAFIKTTHGSGTNMLYTRNQGFDRSRFERVFRKALRENYYYQSREWNYKKVQPRVIVERVLEQHPFLIDYRFMCFEGQVKLILVDIETAAEDGSHNPGARRNVYDTNFDLLDVRIGRDNFDPSLISKPDNLSEMIECAERLSSPFPHCRVDLYNVDGKVYFGEMTFYHGGGCQIITPMEWDLRLGSWIDLESPKIVRPTGFRD